MSTDLTESEFEQLEEYIGKLGKTWPSIDQTNQPLKVGLIVYFFTRVLKRRGVVSVDVEVAFDAIGEPLDISVFSLFTAEDGNYGRRGSDFVLSPRYRVYLEELIGESGASVQPSSDGNDASQSEIVDTTGSAGPSPSLGDGTKTLRDAIATNRSAVIELARIFIQQTQLNIDSLKAQRLNSPEVGEVIERLEAAREDAQSLIHSLEQYDPPEESERYAKRLGNTVLDSLERYVSSDTAIKTVVTTGALIGCSIFGVTPIAQVIVAACAAGDAGVLKSARDLIKAWAGNKSDDSDSESR